MNDCFYDWIFHFNIYTKQWNAVLRDDYKLLFSNSTSDKVLKSGKIETLIEVIHKSGGNLEKIKKIIG